MRQVDKEHAKPKSGIQNGLMIQLAYGEGETTIRAYICSNKMNTYGIIESTE
jgi:hypothetical protein